MTNSNELEELRKRVEELEKQLADVKLGEPLWRTIIHETNNFSRACELSVDTMLLEDARDIVTRLSKNTGRKFELRLEPTSQYNEWEGTLYCCGNSGVYIKCLDISLLNIIPPLKA